MDPEAEFRRLYEERFSAEPFVAALREKRLRDGERDRQLRR